MLTSVPLDMMSGGHVMWDAQPGAFDFEDFATSWMQQSNGRHPPGCTCVLHGTHISDLPEPILTNIFASVSDVRTRNSMSLVCRDWYLLDRYTRTTLCLRGNIVDLAALPMCFNQVTTLDLSRISPWGYSIFQTTNQSDRIARFMVQAFPLVEDLTIYVKNVYHIQLVPFLWPNVESVTLVRWHQRPTEPEDALEPGTELHLLLTACPKLRKLDLSKFYCWTEDVPPALVVGTVSSSLKSLNLLKLSPEGFRAQDLATITGACKSLEEFYVLCDFDPRFVDPVGDQALVSLGQTCTRLRVLHLVDTNAWDASRGDVGDGFTGEDANITPAGLQQMFKSLPRLEELVFLLAQSVKDVGPALETLPVVCKKLKVLKLSHFHGVCKGPEPDGVARCKQLKKLTIKNCFDLHDASLAAIGKGCVQLDQFHLRGIGTISRDGLAECVKRLSGTLKDVEVSRCEQLNAAQVFQALEPVSASLETLSLDCVWDMEIVARESAAAAAAVKAPGILSVADILGMSAEDLFLGGTGGSSHRGRHPALVGKKGNTRSSGGRTTGGSGFPGTLNQGSDFVKVGFDASEGGSDFVTAGFDAGDKPSSDFVTMGFDPGGGSDFVTPGFDSDDQFEPQNKRAKTCARGEDSFVERGVPSSWNVQPDSAGFDVNNPISSSRGHASLHPFPQDPSYFGHKDLSGKAYDDGSWMQGEMSHPCAYGSEYAYPGSKAGSCPGDKLHKQTQSAAYPLMPGDHSVMSWGHRDSTQVIQQKAPRDSWSSLKRLFLRIAPWDLIEYLPVMGLRTCPVLEEIRIRVEGDVKALTVPPQKAWGLGSLERYPSLSKLVLDVSDAQGYALSAPQGCCDISQWERYFLSDLRHLRLTELDYSPPLDKDINYRGLTLPGVGLLSECLSLRKLFVHGTLHEHFLFMLQQLTSLRDFQIRSDYYPAPPDDTTTELRPLSCKRFEVAIAQRGYPD